MKRIFLYTAIVLAMGSICFIATSCGDDDEEKIKIDYQSMLLGSWRYTYTDYDGIEYFDVVTFYADGTGKQVEYDEYGRPEDDENRFTYVLKYPYLYIDGESSEIEFVGNDKLRIFYDKGNKKVCDELIRDNSSHDVDPVEPDENNTVVAGALNAGKGSSDLPVGYRLQSVYGFEFGYKSNGVLSDIWYDDESLNFSPNSCQFSNTYPDGARVKFTYELNEKGYISKIREKFDINSSNLEDHTDITVSVIYNDNDQVKKISGNGTQSVNDDGNVWSGQFTITANLTYNGDILKKVEFNEKGTYDDGYVLNDGAVSTLSSCSHENPYFQYTGNVLDAVLGDLFDEEIYSVAFLGLLGKATGALPGKISYEYWNDNENDDDEWEETCSYSYNSYGALKEANDDQYTYTTLNDATRSTEYKCLASPKTSARHLRKAANRHQRHYRRFRDRENSSE